MRECYYCGEQLNNNEGHVRFDEVQTGRLGSSWTVRLLGSATASRNSSRRGSSSAARNSGRKLYKTMRVIACDVCNEQKVKWAKIKFWTKTVIYTSIAAALIYITQPLWKVELPKEYYKAASVVKKLN